MRRGEAGPRLEIIIPHGAAWANFRDDHFVISEPTKKVMQPKYWREVGCFTSSDKTRSLYCLYI